MIQEIAVYIIICGAILIILRSLRKSLQPVKKVSGCDGCSGCALRDVSQACTTKIS